MRNDCQKCEALRGYCHKTNWMESLNINGLLQKDRARLWEWTIVEPTATQMYQLRTHECDWMIWGTVELDHGMKMIIGMTRYKHVKTFSALLKGNMYNPNTLRQPLNPPILYRQILSMQNVETNGNPHHINNLRPRLIDPILPQN